MVIFSCLIHEKQDYFPEMGLLILIFSILNIKIG